MEVTVPARQLCVGMYVDLSGHWRDHPFLRNRFRIASGKDVEKIVEAGIAAVTVDLDRSRIAPQVRHEIQRRLLQEAECGAHHDGGDGSGEAEIEPPGEWNPENLVPPELQEAIGDQRLDPERKAKMVYRHSVEMMQRLLASPSAENLVQGKKAIYSIADLILSDQATAKNLLHITSHDFYTYTHSVNVGVLSILLSKALFRGSDAHNIEELGAGFFLHDLGKVRVDPAIINKAGRLDEHEMQRMRTHPYQGYKLLKEADALTEECRYIVMQHHERADGTGYPKRLHNEEIHIYGKICCIADVYDALTAERSYKKALSTFDALQLMKEEMSHHFDKALFSAFVQLFR
ncbi:MAG: hypothetical protein Kow006_18800 [Gammaproteobacteria bacterium]